jgi:YidC/Oxa1 family membrane protein insertase
MAQGRPTRTPNVRRLVIFLLVVALISVLIAGVVSVTGVWNTILLRPMLNFLVLVSHYLLGNFGIAIIVLTILLRILMLPLTMRQLQSSKAMQLMQPKLNELQKKYAKDRPKLGQETLKLYKEAGINQTGCVFSILSQFPIWVALYQSVVQALAYTPENLFGLSKQLYYPMVLQEAVPINHHFLWLDLTRGDIVMVFLVGGSAWVLTKMTYMPTGTQQRLMNRVMLWALPLFFAFLAFTLPSGLSLFWLTTNVIGMILQYRVTGWGTLKMPSMSFLKRGAPQPVDDPMTKTKRAAGTGKKAGESDTISQQSNVRGQKHGDERKD